MVVVLIIMGLAFAGGLATMRRLGGSGSTTSTTTIGPNPILCPVEPANGEAAIMAAISSCPNGTPAAPTLVRFPAGGTYTQANKIELRDRNHLIIDGNGSTFTTSANGSTTKGVNGNWVLLRGTNITLKNMTAIGSFDLAGPRSGDALSADPRYSDASMNYGVYGTDGAWLVDVKGFDAWGDAVTLGPAHYIDTTHFGSHTYARNVHIIRMEAKRTARHCWSPTSGVGVWIEDSSCTDAWYVGLDAEIDNATQLLQDLHILRNTFTGYFNAGLLIPGPGEVGNVKDIEIRGNKFLTPPDNKCNQTLQVGIYPGIDNDPNDGHPDPNPPMKWYDFQNVVVEGNEFHTYDLAINFDHVNGGKIQGNKIETIPPPTGVFLHVCGYQAARGQVVLTNSAGVVVEDNG